MRRGPAASTSTVRAARWARVVLVTTAVVGASFVLLWLRFSSFTVTGLLSTPRLNHEASYQLVTLGLFAFFVMIAVALGGRGVLAYLRPTRFSGPVTPVPWIGLRPKEGEGWLKVGSSFLVVITLVTAVTVSVPAIRGGALTFSVTGVLLPALAFALTNSLVEEGIYRFAVTSVFLENGFSATSAAITSGLLFGSVHYFGTPGGIAGVFLAGFLGWLLSKSIAETRGFGWAWSIHFVQDVVIFVAILGTS